MNANPLDVADQDQWKQAPRFQTGSVADLRLNGRVALVVGATGHIGRAISEALALHGASVAIHYLTHEDQAKVISKGIVEAGSTSMVVRADISVSHDVEKMVSTVLEKFGTVDILVNAAGISPSTDPVIDLDEATLERILEVNLKGPFLCCKFAAPVMIKKRYGRIVNVSSIFARNAPARRAAYSASKHGLIGLTQALSKELAPYNITVNAVCPGPMMSPLVHHTFEKIAREAGISVDEYYKARQSKIPIGRLGDPDELALVVLFLASDMARYVTGAALDVSGGAIE
jgi:3-oxoacyl-[acyl-carrier protein] reductase